MATKTEQALGLQFGAPYGEANWNVWMDENLVKLGATAQISVKNKTTTTPPTLVEGERYIVATGATGDWLSKDGQLAFAVDGSWMFYPLKRGWLVVDESDDSLKLWNGTSFVEPSAAAIDAVSDAVDAEAATRAAADTAEANARADADTTLQNNIDAEATARASADAGKQVNILFRDDGTNLGTTGTVNVVDFTGAGVTATRDGDVLTVDITGGGGGGGGGTPLTEGAYRLDCDAAVLAAANYGHLPTDDQWATSFTYVQTGALPVGASGGNQAAIAAPTDYPTSGGLLRPADVPLACQMNVTDWSATSGQVVQPKGMAIFIVSSGGSLAGFMSASFMSNGTILSIHRDVNGTSVDTALDGNNAEGKNISIYVLPNGDVGYTAAGIDYGVQSGITVGATDRIFFVMLADDNGSATVGVSVSGILVPHASGITEPVPANSVDLFGNTIRAGVVIPEDRTYVIPTHFASWAALRTYLERNVHTGRVDVVFAAGHVIDECVDCSGLLMPNLNFIATDTPQQVDLTGVTTALGAPVLFLLLDSHIGSIKGEYDLIAGGPAGGVYGRGTFGLGRLLPGGSPEDLSLDGFAYALYITGGSVTGYGEFISTGSTHVQMVAARVQDLHITTDATAINIGAFTDGAVSGSFKALTLNAATEAYVQIKNSNLSFVSVDFQSPAGRFIAEDSRVSVREMDTPDEFYAASFGGADTYIHLKAGASFGCNTAASNSGVFSARDALSAMRVFCDNGDNVTFICRSTGESVTWNGYGTHDFVMYASTLTVDSTLAVPNYIFTHGRGRAAATVSGSYGALSSTAFNTGGAALFNS